jgi:hypothetical protein
VRPKSPNIGQEITITIQQTQVEHDDLDDVSQNSLSCLLAGGSARDGVPAVSEHARQDGPPA